MLTHETCAALLHTKFKVEVQMSTGETQQVELELAEVSELKVFPQQEQFALVFRGPNEIMLTQGSRLLTHEQLGELELFMVPVGQEPAGLLYEAVFNRLTNQTGETAGAS
jgi:hypothetical protein